MDLDTAVLFRRVETLEEEQRQLQRQLTQLGDQLRAQAALARGPEGPRGKQGPPGRDGRNGRDGDNAATVIREVKIVG